jgi:DNA polymerase-3 subunit delta'
MSDAFDTILGQPYVRDYLRAAVEGAHVSHAYLFAGAPGSNKRQAASSFARALLCPKGAKGPRGGKCGACDVCSHVERGMHPDVHEVYPQGAAGYLIEQIRELNSDALRAPVKAQKSVYILHDAEKFGTVCANAFLKTLEEPPDNVVFILLGRDAQSVLPTIVSRCQIVSFRHIPSSEAAGIVAQNTGCDIALARAAIDAAGGSITGAIEFLSAADNRLIAFRNKLLAALPGLAQGGDYSCIKLAKEIITDLKAPLDDLLAKQAAEIDDYRDFYSPSILRRIEARNKRQMSADTTKQLKQTISIIESWLRDVSYCATNKTDLCVNVDFMNDIAKVARNANVSDFARALAELQKLYNALDYNVSPESCIGCALLRVREVLKRADSAGQPSI